MSYKINEVAKIVGISVRTLHHYNNIGLLIPETVSESGYRFYGTNELIRLQQILFFKELDFTLTEIKEILDNSDFDREKALQSHKNLLLKKRNRIDQIIKTVEKTIMSIKGENKMATEEMFGGFDMKEIEEHKQKYADEVKQRWGNSQAYKESERKTKNYKKEDWARIKNEQEYIYKKFIDSMDKGFSSPDAQAAVKEWQQSITKNFYNCSNEILRGLGDMYVSDDRFTQNIDKYKPGLSLFLKNAFDYYCDNNS